MSKVAVLLSGCGVYDGAEIHESVLTLLALGRHGAEVSVLAPDRPQMHVVNHHTGEVASGETRNVLVEAARIARGAVQDVAHVKAQDFDALILPGGYGAAKNLCSFAIDGADAAVDDGVATLVREMFEAGKPIGFICISPVIAAKILGKQEVELTIGNDRETADALEKMGARHVVKGVDEIHQDPRHKVVSTPAYMLGPEIGDVAKGIDKLVDSVMEMLS